MKRPFFFVVNLILPLSLSWTSAFAQFQKPPVNIPSPNAASLGMYGEVPVSLFTGLPQIDIPLYTVKEGDLAVPISLSYHASGFKPNIRPGWVGMSWNLNSGGSITRKMNDEIDEFDFISCSGINQNSEVHYQYGYYYMYDFVKKRQFADFHDSEPDEFSFNFLQYSGSFYLDENRKWKVRANAKLDVIFNGQFLDLPFQAPSGRFCNGKYAKCFSGFTLVDEAGIQYEFGGTADAIEFNIPFFFYEHQEAHWKASTWHLTKIKSPSGRIITFHYGHTERPDIYTTNTRKEFICTLFTSTYERSFKVENNSTTFFQRLVNTFLDPTEPSLLSPKLDCSRIAYDDATALSGELISPVYLDRIETSQEKILFQRSISNELTYTNAVYSHFLARVKSYTPGSNLLYFLSDEKGHAGSYTQDFWNSIANLQWKKLDKMEVFRKDVSYGSIPLKQVDFTYNNTLQPKPNERLALLAVQEKGNGAAKPPYLFYYDQSKPLPLYLEDYTDHWGYYTGRTYTVPFMMDKTKAEQFYLNREVNPDYLRAGVLNKIVYPTQGITELQYEPHTFSQRLNDRRTGLLPPASGAAFEYAGGLRIRKITNRTSENGPVTLEKNYYYVRNYTPSANPTTLPASGILGGGVRYFWDDYWIKAYNSNYELTQTVFSANSLMPASSNSRGSHIGYSEVVEQLSDGSYTLYKYTNFDTGHMDEVIPDQDRLNPTSTKTIYDAYIDKSFERGNLLVKELYTAQGKPVKKESYAYRSLSDEAVPSISFSPFNECASGINAQFREGYTYKHYTYQFKPYQEESYVYDQNDPTKFSRTTTNYAHNANGQVNVTRTAQSDGTERVTFQQYPSDYALSNTTITSLQAEYINELQKQHIFSPVIEQYTRENGQVVSGLFTTYRRNLASTGQVQLVPDRVYGLETEAPLNNFTPSKMENGNLVRDGRYKERVKYHQYDSYANLLDYSKDQQPVTSYLWGYNKTLPIAQLRHDRPVPVHEVVPANRTITPTFGVNVRDDDASYHNGYSLRETPLGVELSRAQNVRVSFKAWIPEQYQGPLHGFASSSIYLKLGDQLLTIGSVGNSNLGTSAENAPEYTVTLTNLTAGNYKLAYDVSGLTPVELRRGVIIIQVTINYQEFIPTPNQWVCYHTSFEEETTNINVTDGLTGRKSYTGGSWVIPAEQRPVAGTYVLSYWEKVNGKWEYRQQTLSYSPSNSPLISTNNPIDEVRLYPPGGLMTTYTYDPLVGMTSMTDANGVTTYYEYDGLQRLKTVKDQLGSPVKSYNYHYKQ